MTRGSKGGFALPAVLVAVAVLALVFLTALQGLDALRSNARSALGAVAFEQQALTAEARVGYLVATRPWGPAAIEAPAARGLSRGGDDSVLQLDGRLYRLTDAPGVSVSAQDEAGLVNLDQLPQDAAARLFVRLQTAPDPEGELADRFADYVDADQLKRAHGAERAEYLAAGRPPPPNRPLRSEAELLGVLGWSQRVSPDVWRAWRDRLTADPTSAEVNVNTAPPEVLEVLYGASPAQAAAAVRRRAAAPFVSLEDFGRAAGLALHGDAERTYTRINGRVALTLEAPGGLVFHSRVLFIPGDTERPVWFEDRRISTQPAGARPAQLRDAVDFPEPAS